MTVLKNIPEMSGDYQAVFRTIIVSVFISHIIRRIMIQLIPL